MNSHIGMPAYLPFFLFSSPCMQCIQEPRSLLGTASHGITLTPPLSSPNTTMCPCTFHLLAAPQWYQGQEGEKKGGRRGGGLTMIQDVINTLRDDMNSKLEYIATRSKNFQALCRIFLFCLVHSFFFIIFLFYFILFYFILFYFILSYLSLS